MAQHGEGVLEVSDLVQLRATEGAGSLGGPKLHEVGHLEDALTMLRHLAAVPD